MDSPPAHEEDDTPTPQIERKSWHADPEWKVALVTGAATGIGAASARRLAQDGIALGVLDLDEERCAETVTSIEAAGGKAVALGADISHREQVKAAVAKLRQTLGPVAILVNNAAVSGYAPFLEMTDEQWDTVIRINLRTGAFIVSQVAVPDMVTAGWRRVINISSMGAQGLRKCATENQALHADSTN